METTLRGERRSDAAHCRDRRRSGDGDPVVRNLHPVSCTGPGFERHQHTRCRNTEPCERCLRIRGSLGRRRRRPQHCCEQCHSTPERHGARHTAPRIKIAQVFPSLSCVRPHAPTGWWPGDHGTNWSSLKSNL
ncbi:hypothetical protein SPHINGO8AM_180164 [Sphingomonas sp. 8AM]|nr:hypothetical protein SPHINGO8AM_180164 [Sphingomonas sp. 8AM]